MTKTQDYETTKDFSRLDFMKVSAAYGVSGCAALLLPGLLRFMRHIDTEEPPLFSPVINSYQLRQLQTAGHQYDTHDTSFLEPKFPFSLEQAMSSLKSTRFFNATRKDKLPLHASQINQAMYPNFFNSTSIDSVFYMYNACVPAVFATVMRLFEYMRNGNPETTIANTALHIREGYFTDTNDQRLPNYLGGEPQTNPAIIPQALEQLDTTQGLFQVVTLLPEIQLHEAEKKSVILFSDSKIAQILKDAKEQVTEKGGIVLFLTVTPMGGTNLFGHIIATTNTSADMQRRITVVNPMNQKAISASFDATFPLRDFSEFGIPTPNRGIYYAIGVIPTFLSDQNKKQSVPL